jgi:hypothetical protein
MKTGKKAKIREKAMEAIKRIDINRNNLSILKLLILSKLISDPYEEHQLDDKLVVWARKIKGLKLKMYIYRRKSWYVVTCKKK